MKLLHPFFIHFYSLLHTLVIFRHHPFLIGMSHKVFQYIREEGIQDGEEIGTIRESLLVTHIWKVNLELRIVFVQRPQSFHRELRIIRYSRDVDSQPVEQLFLS